jgi:hypothetical protein
MFEMDQTYLAYELAYRTEQLTGRRQGERVHHLPATRRGRGRRSRGQRRPVTR